MEHRLQAWVTMVSSHDTQRANGSDEAWLTPHYTDPLYSFRASDQLDQYLLSPSPLCIFPKALSMSKM